MRVQINHPHKETELVIGDTLWHTLIYGITELPLEKETYRLSSIYTKICVRLLSRFIVCIKAVKTGELNRSLNGLF